MEVKVDVLKKTRGKATVKYLAHFTLLSTDCDVALMMFSLNMK